MKQSKQDSLAKACKDLMLKEPFYGLFLISLNKKWNDRVGTAGVAKNGINFELHIAEPFWDELTPDHRIGLLKHELLHIGFFHLTMFDDLKNHKLANIAMDIEINQYIDPQFLPPNGTTLEAYAEFNLPVKAGCRVYYDLLQKELDKINQKMQGQGSSDSKNKLEKALEAMENGDSTDSDGTLVPDHSSWEEFEKLNEAEKKLLTSQLEYQLKNIAEHIEKSRGTIPGEFTSILEKINNQEAPKFDWKSYLRRFTGGSQKVFTKKLRRKPNKRFEDNPGLKIKKKRHVLVAVDTSGSVSNKELVEFFAEIDHIHRTGTDITVIQCDSAISSIEPYKHNAEIKLHGRGGTSFDPVLEYYNANDNTYTCLIYLTDGECSTDVKVRGKMLWVISTRGAINKSLVGPQIKLN